ncbi:hypothetical protein PLICRDRAFT_70555, partial [Plicaturopsis crispa FD-325 SS-3]
LFDWMRKLYAQMAYLVRHGKMTSAEFASLVGLLTGDTASPGLWNLYFADCNVPEDVDDIMLNGRRVSFVAQADDVAIWSTTAAGVQRKIATFMIWCSVNFMVIAALKCSWMIFGEIPTPIPTIHIGDTTITLVDCYKYVGVWFRSTHRNIFAEHYITKASKAVNMSHAIFAVEHRIGAMPAFEGRQLYMARVDPHLISGCEVALDVDEGLLKELEDAQHSFLRRLLGVNRRGLICTLFTETGVLPIKFRRVTLALRYARYLIGLPERRFARAALLDSLALARRGRACWVGDLRHVLCSLPTPVLLPDHLMTEDGLLATIDAVKLSCDTWLQKCLLDSPKTYLLHHRLETDGIGRLQVTAMAFRHYLFLPIARHRKALTRLLQGDTPFAVERGRWDERYRKRIPREWRLCRFCHVGVEDECHALLICDGNGDLACLRKRFLEDAQIIDAR